MTATTRKPRRAKKKAAPQSLLTRVLMHKADAATREIERATFPHDWMQSHDADGVPVMTCTKCGKQTRNVTLNDWCKFSAPYVKAAEKPVAAPMSDAIREFLICAEMLSNIAYNCKQQDRIPGDVRRSCEEAQTRCDAALPKFRAEIDRLRTEVAAKDAEIRRLLTENDGLRAMRLRFAHATGKGKRGAK